MVGMVRITAKAFWGVCSAKTVAEFSGIGYTFARRLHMAMQVPIGVIDVSRGGTCVETWTPIELLRQRRHQKAPGRVGCQGQGLEPEEGPRSGLHFTSAQKEGKAPANAKEPTELAPRPRS